MLTALGVAELVDVVVSPQVVDDLKLGLRMYKQVIRDVEVQPECCLMLGDRDPVDLEPGRRLGMNCELITGPSDVVKILNVLAAEVKIGMI